MARLGSVVGSILAELAQARVIADQATRDLVADYEADPVLATMPVPRMELDSVSLTLRFTVDDLVESEREDPSPGEIQSELERSIIDAVRRLTARGPRPRTGTDPFGRREAAEAAAKLSQNATPTLSLSESAFKARDVGRVSADVTARIMANWDGVAPDVRSTLGTKAAFQRSVTAELDKTVRAAFTRLESSAQVNQALTSSMIVGVRSADMPAEPEKVQELTLMVRGSDLDFVIAADEGTR